MRGPLREATGCLGPPLASPGAGQAETTIGRAGSPAGIGPLAVSENPAMLERLTLADGKLTRTDQPDAAVLLYTNPDEQERRYLIDTLKVDEHTLLSALDPDELGRLEFEPDHAAVILKRPKNYSSEDRFVFRVSSAGLFLYHDKLVIVVSEEMAPFAGKHFARIASLPELVLRMIYSSIVHFVEHLKVINAVSDSLEDQINASMQNKYLLNLFSLEKSLVYYLNGINSNAKVIERLKNNAAKFGLTQENLEYIDDMLIENSQCYEQANVYSNILASMMDARASIVGNNLNWLIKTLTIITIAIMLPTLVVSVFSMNVPFPGKDYEHMFWIIVGLAGMSVVAVRMVWRWQKW